MVVDFRERPLGKSRYVWLDALYEKVRADNRVESMAVVVAIGINQEGRREVLGFDVIPTESEEGWTQFLKSLKERGLTGVELVISDAHTGLKAAARKVFKASVATVQSSVLPECIGACAQAKPGGSERGH